MRKIISTDKVVKQEHVEIICDRCGKPAIPFGWDTGFRIPVVVRDHHTEKRKWEHYKIDACRECIEMVWRMFDCKGITKLEIEAETKRSQP